MTSGCYVDRRSQARIWKKESVHLCIMVRCQCLLYVMGLFKLSVSRNPRSQERNSSGHLSARPLLQLPAGSTAGDAGAAAHILWSFNIYDLIPGLHINNLWETFNTRSKKYKNKTSALSFQFSHTNTWFFSLFDVRA